MGIFNKSCRGQIVAWSLLNTCLLAACFSPQANTSTTSTLPTNSSAGDTLRLLYWQAPTILNPHLAQGTKDFEASRI